MASEPLQTHVMVPGGLSGQGLLHSYLTNEAYRRTHASACIAFRSSVPNQKFADNAAASPVTYTETDKLSAHALHSAGTVLSAGP